MSWSDTLNGGPAHIGVCDCGEQNGSCNDGPCEDCISKTPVKCPDCGDMVHPEFMTEHGCCIVCLEERANEFPLKMEQVEAAIFYGREALEELRTV